CHRARATQGSANPDPRRSHQRARSGHRIEGAGGARRSHEGPYHLRDCAPSRYRAQCHAHSGIPERTRDRDRHVRRAAAAGRIFQRAGAGAVRHRRRAGGTGARRAARRTMMSALDLITLALGLAAFVFIVVVGSRNKRIAGVLLTFPTMNAIALLTSPDPFRVADAIALLVVFNTLLFWAAVMTLRFVPPRPERFAPLTLLVCRVMVWTAVWCAAAYWLTDNRDRFPSETILFALALVLAIGVALVLWRPPPIEPKQSTPEAISGPLNWTVRIVLFLAVYAALLYAARHASDQKWTGMASALPIIGFFGL